MAKTLKDLLEKVKQHFSSVPSVIPKGPAPINLQNVGQFASGAAQGSWGVAGAIPGAQQLFTKMGLRPTLPTYNTIPYKMGEFIGGVAPTLPVFGAGISLGERLAGKTVLAQLPRIGRFIKPATGLLTGQALTSAVATPGTVKRRVEAAGRTLSPANLAMNLPFILAGGLKIKGGPKAIFEAEALKGKIPKSLQLLAQEAGYKKFVKNAYLVASKQKNQAQVARIKSAFGLPADTPEKVILRAETFDKILEKHPDKLNVDFNKALGFVKTLNLPDAVNNLPEKQRINFIRNIANDYLNLVGVKPVIQKGETYLNTSFVTSKLSKYGPEGLATPSSPIGVGARLPTSDTSIRSISNLSSKSELDAFLKGKTQDVVVQRPMYTQATKGVGGVGEFKMAQTAPRLQGFPKVPAIAKIVPEGKVRITGQVSQAGGRQLGGVGVPPSGNIIPDKDLIFQLTAAIKEAKPIRGTQEQLYTKARGQKLARLMSAREKMAGEKGFFEELGALKGELPKVEYESIRQNFTQENVDRLFNMVKSGERLGEWDKVNAQVGLAKILGEKGGGVPTKKELEHLYNIFGKDFTEALLSKRSLLEKLGDLGMQVYNLPRSMMAGVADFSGTLMQNLLFAYRHPIMTIKNFGQQVKMFASDSFYKASQQEIAERPTYEAMKKARVQLTEVSPIIAQREEQFMSSLAEKIPGFGRLVKATGRAWTGFLNRMRADVFDQLVESQKALGLDINDAKFLKDAGEFVNAGTGRGGLGKLERSASLLSQGLFSARKLAATVKFLDPRVYVTTSPVVRKEYLKTMLSFLAGGTIITQLAKMGGAEVGDEPTSADYGKIKIGNTRLNVWGPYQQMAVLMARLWKGYGISSTTGRKFVLGEGYKPATRLDLIGRFFEMKEHPTLSLILSSLRGQNQIGQPFNLPVETLNRFIPMVLSDAYDLYKEHGPVGLLGIIPSILGIPTQTYGTQVPSLETTPTGKLTIKLKPTGGIGEDLWAKISEQPVSNIPESQWAEIVSAKTQEQQQANLKAEVKQNAERGIMRPQGNFVPVIIDGQVKVIDTSFTLPTLTLTGQGELDKQLISKYKNKLNLVKNDVMDAFGGEVIDQGQAMKLLRKIKDAATSANTKSAKVKKPKVVTIKKLSAKVPSIKIKKPKKLAVIKIKKLKRIKIGKGYKPKNILSGLGTIPKQYKLPKYKNSLSNIGTRLL